MSKKRRVSVVRRNGVVPHGAVSLKRRPATLRDVEVARAKAKKKPSQKQADGRSLRMSAPPTQALVINPKLLARLEKQ